MINATDLRAGTIYRERGFLLKVLDYKHQKIARGGANIILKVKNLFSGAVVRKSYPSGKKVEGVRLESVGAVYLYKQDNEYYFMDSGTYDQFGVSDGIVGAAGRYLKDGLEVKIRLFEGKVVDMELPVKIAYIVAEAPPDIRGNTAQGGNKEVELENGLMVSAPMFIKKTDKIVIDTRNGGYVGRV